ncbi:transcriptional regulator, partial [Vibrio vulnificus]
MKHVTAAALAEEIGDRLKQARLNRDLTQSEVAEIAGIARKTVLNAEKG